MLAEKCSASILVRTRWSSLSLSRTQVPVSRNARSPNRANIEILHELYTTTEQPRLEVKSHACHSIEPFPLQTLQQNNRRIRLNIVIDCLKWMTFPNRYMQLVLSEEYKAESLPKIQHSKLLLPGPQQYLTSWLRISKMKERVIILSTSVVQEMAPLNRKQIIAPNAEVILFSNGDCNDPP